MIISDAHRLAFIHIPKCAGVSVKQPLRVIDSTAGYFSRIGDHAAMGRVHFAHIVLEDLARHFPDEFAKVQSYRAFAVVRDPMDRFVSALFQRLREFGGLAQSQITSSRLEQEATEVIARLERGPGRLGLELVHFNRQIDYVSCAGERIVDDLFALEDMGRLRSYVGDLTGIAIGTEPKNMSSGLRFGALQAMARTFRRPYVSLVPHGFRMGLRRTLVRAGLYTQANRGVELPAAGKIAGFVRSHYAEDYALHAALR